MYCLYENTPQSKEKSQYVQESEVCTNYFDKWSDQDQTEYVELMLSKMTHYQHSLISSFLRPMLQRDFISLLPSMYPIFIYL